MADPNITEEVHFEMLEKKSDGSFKAKYPKIKSKSGVTFDEHLAEKATETKLGHVLLGEVENTWRKIGEVTVDTPTTQIDIDILNNYEEIRVYGANIGITSGSELHARFNDITSNSYRHAYVVVGGTSGPNTLAYANIMTDVSDSQLRSFVMNIFPNIDRNYCTIFSGAGLGQFQYTTFTVMDTMFGDIDKITLYPNGGEININAKIKVWGR